MGSSRFAEAHLGTEQLQSGGFIPRHRHAQGYVAVVLAGSYTEAGDEGRRRLQAGDALTHLPYDAHLDHVGRGQAQVLNLPLPASASLPMAFQVADADALARLGERDLAAASAQLLRMATAAVEQAPDWPDLLATELRAAPHTRLSEWADRMGLAPVTLSRGFKSVFGVTPARYRAETRARQAYTALVQGREPLVELALAHGFADQAHLSRAITGLTGSTPSAWRGRSNLFKTAVTSPA